MSDLRIRGFQPQDLPRLCQIFYDAVHIGAAEAYSDKERRAWAPHVPEPEVWGPRLSDQMTLVACQPDPVGFFTLSEKGYVDLAFVAPKVKGRGVAYALSQDMEARLRGLGTKEMRTEASLVARPFFERQGWEVVEAQRFVQRGAWLRNFKMRKDLA